MSEEFEKTMRAKAEALLMARATETAATRHAGRARTKEDKARYKRAIRTRALRKRAKQAELKRERNAGKVHARNRSQGVTLAERLLARTDPDKWYYFRQLEAMMTDTGRNGLKAIVYQKMPKLGWIERKALFEDVPNKHLEAMGLKPAEAWRVLSQPKYVYRIGAGKGVERARAREKLSALTSERFD